MRRSLPSLLVIGLLAALLVSCGQSATVQQTAASPTASSHAHLSRIAWQGFLDHDQTTAAIFSANADGSDVPSSHTPTTGMKTPILPGHRMAPQSSSPSTLPMPPATSF